MKNIIKGIYKTSWVATKQTIVGPMEDTYEGFAIVTNQELVELGISNQQLCCETWGYLSTPDDIQEFVGAELLSIEPIKGPKKPSGEEEYKKVIYFININTSQGLLQLTVYNEHNGYYGHSVVYSCNKEAIDLNDDV